MTPEELNELDDKRFLEVHEEGTYFREIKDEAVNRKEVIYNSAADAKTMNEISNKEQEIFDKDADSFKIVPEIEEIELGASIAMKAKAIKSAANPVPNDPNVAWDSSDWEVAYFTEGNVLNAVKVGEVVITAVDVQNREIAPVTKTIAVVDPNVAKEEEEVEPTVFTITYDASTGVVVPAPSTTDENGKFTVTDFVPEVTEGFYFAGWTIEGREGIFKAGEEVTVSADTTLTASILPQPTLYTITYVAEGATNVPEAGQTDPDGEFVVSDVIPVLDGHTFSGWSMEGHEGNLNAGDRVTVSADTTLTAVFAQEVEPDPVAEP